MLTKHTLIVEHYVTWIDESSCFLDYTLSQMMNFYYFKLIKCCVFIKEKKNDYNNNKKEINNNIIIIIIIILGSMATMWHSSL